MDTDLLALRELGDSRTPPDGDQPPADLRRRVLTGMLVDQRRHRRPAWVPGRFAVAGTLSAVTVAVAGLLLTSATAPHTGAAPPTGATQVPTTAPIPVDPAARTRQVLTLAARHAAATPARPARADQFVFTESLRQSVALVSWGPTFLDAKPMFGPPQRLYLWESVNGTRDGLARSTSVTGGPRDARDSGAIPGCRNGRNKPTQDRPDAEQSCEAYPAYRTDLPIDVDAMTRYLYRDGGDDAGTYDPGLSPDQRAFFRVTKLILTSLPAPAVQAAAFQAAALIPGVTLVESATDLAGRVGVAVSRTDGGIRDEVIFDSGTYAYLGQSRVVVQDDPGALSAFRGLGLKAGDVLERDAVLRVAIVDRAGQLP